MKHTERKTVAERLFFPKLLLCLLFTLTPCSVNGQPSDEVQHKNVLVVYDEQDKLPGLAILDQSIRSTLSSDPSLRINIFTENLDRSRLQKAGYYESLGSHFRQKYSDKKFDVIISAMGPSLDFVIEHGADIFPGIPIIFCGIDRRELENRKLGPNTTGVLVKREFKGTMESALKLQPDTQNVYFISGSSEFDRRLADQARSEFREFENRVKIEYLTDFEMDRLLQKISQLPANSVVLASTVFNDNTGKSFVPHDVVVSISQKANAPVFGFVDQYLGRGIVGGHLYSLEEHGKKAAEITLQVLRGQDVASIPFAEGGASLDLFDWRELRRWGLDEYALPVGSVVRYRTLSVWDQYRWYITAAVAIGIIQSLLISGLLIAQSRRRRAEHERGVFRSLAEAEHRKLNAVVENISVIVWESRIDPDTHDRRVEFVSSYVEKMLGYTPEEIVSTPNFWSTVVLDQDDPEKLHDVTTDNLAWTPKGVQQFRCRTKQAKVIWIDAYLDAMYDETGNIIGLRGVAIDVTDKKDTEKAIMLLGSKLINAQEEERRRVARELHDGLGQSLALSSIQLAELHREAAEQPLIQRRVEDLMQMLEALLSDLRRISHELHPAKLEQLGLEPALIGLCREVGAAHNLNIKFEAKNIPRLLPNDVSLCLYRVTQEALQNVQKHSGALSADVRIGIEKDFIDLEVSDDGIGFDTEAAVGKESLGLISMQERIRSVKGRIAVESHRGAGTRIIVRVPA